MASCMSVYLWGFSLVDLLVPPTNKVMLWYQFHQIYFFVILNDNAAKHESLNLLTLPSPPCPFSCTKVVPLPLSQRVPEPVRFGSGCLHLEQTWSASLWFALRMDWEQQPASWPLEVKFSSDLWQCLQGS